MRWRRTPVAERAAVVARLGALLDAEKDQLGRLMTLEMGKPIQAAIDEAAKCATGCRFYAEHGPSFVADARVDDDGHRSFVTYQPLGVVLAIMPWNFPFWQVIRFLAPGAGGGQRRACSSTRRTCRGARWSSSRSSDAPARPTACSRRCSSAATRWRGCSPIGA